MLHIAVVDDEQEQRSLPEELLHRFERENGQSFGISQFGDAGEFLRQDPGIFDIVLLDIQMPGLDGMSVARQLREKNRHLVLIFITNMAQFAIEGYAVDAMDFILKPVSYYRLAASLTKARSRLLTEQGVPLLLHTKDGTYRLDSARVHYIEMLNHHTIFHTTDGIFDTTGSLKKTGGTADRAELCPLQQRLPGQSALCPRGGGQRCGGGRRPAADQPDPAQGVFAAAVGILRGDSEMLQQTQLSWYKILFLVELLVAEGVFCHKLRRRPGFVLRLVACLAICFAFAAWYPLGPYTVFSNSVLFFAIFFVTLLACKVCFDESW